LSWRHNGEIGAASVPYRHSTHVVYPRTVYTDLNS
jgi:hypothetical protein